jgi:hypothetical protein
MSENAQETHGLRNFVEARNGLSIRQRRGLRLGFTAI